jgi:Cu-processing system permease protein
MQKLLKIIRYEMQAHSRSKWLLVYTLFFWLSTDLLYRFAGTGAQIVISMLNIVLIIIPLVSLVFGVIYLYSSREFIELLLTQPINRNQLYWGLYLGLVIPLCAGFALGIIIPLVYLPFEGDAIPALISLLITGLAFTFIFCALSFFLALKFEDKIKGLGSAIGLWLFFIIIYDGIFMFLLFTFADFPLDNVSIFFSLVNPVDLGRIFMMLQLDISALMGYTGATFSRFFGSNLGMLVSLTAMLIWIVIPGLSAQKQFLRKDF